MVLLATFIFSMTGTTVGITTYEIVKDLSQPYLNITLARNVGWVVGVTAGASVGRWVVQKVITKSGLTFRAALCLSALSGLTGRGIELLIKKTFN